MPDTELHSSERDGHVVVALCGDLDLVGVAAAEAAITALVARGQSLIIDMSGLDFLDCASLRAVLRIQEFTRRGGGEMVLAAPQPHARRQLALTGKDAALWVAASVPAAAAVLASCSTLTTEERLIVGAARPGRAVPSHAGAG